MSKDTADRAPSTSYDPQATLKVAYDAENALVRRVLRLPAPASAVISGVPQVPPIIPITQLATASSINSQLSLDSEKQDLSRISDLVALDHELQVLFATLFQRLVLPWHRPLTPERGLCQQAHGLVSKLAMRFVSRYPPLVRNSGESAHWLQLRELFSSELPAVLQEHWNTYRTLPADQRDRLAEMDYLTRPHPALKKKSKMSTCPDPSSLLQAVSPQSQSALHLSPLYIQTLVEELLLSYLELEELKSDVARLLLRDIFAAALCMGIQGARPAFWATTLHSVLDALQNLLASMIQEYKPKAQNVDTKLRFQDDGIVGTWIRLVRRFWGWLTFLGHVMFHGVLWLLFASIPAPRTREVEERLPGSYPASTPSSPTTSDLSSSSESHTPKQRLSSVPGTSFVKDQATAVTDTIKETSNASATVPVTSDTAKVSASGAALFAYVEALDQMLDLRCTVLGSLLSLLCRSAVVYWGEELQRWVINNLSRVVTLPRMTSLLRVIYSGALPMDTDDLPPELQHPQPPPEVVAEAACRRSWATLPRHAADAVSSLVLWSVCVGHASAGPLSLLSLPQSVWMAADTYTATGGKMYSYPSPHAQTNTNPNFVSPCPSVPPSSWCPPGWLTRLHESVVSGSRYALSPLCAPDAAPLVLHLAVTLTERVAAVMDPNLLSFKQSQGVRRPSVSVLGRSPTLAENQPASPESSTSSKARQPELLQPTPREPSPISNMPCPHSPHTPSLEIFRDHASSASVMPGTVGEKRAAPLKVVGFPTPQPATLSPFPEPSRSSTPPGHYFPQVDELASASPPSHLPSKLIPFPIPFGSSASASVPHEPSLPSPAHFSTNLLPSKSIARGGQSPLPHLESDVASGVPASGAVMSHPSHSAQLSSSEVSVGSAKSSPVGLEGVSKLSTQSARYAHSQRSNARMLEKSMVHRPVGYYTSPSTPALASPAVVSPLVTAAISSSTSSQEASKGSKAQRNLQRHNTALMQLPSSHYSRPSQSTPPEQKLPLDQASSRPVSSSASARPDTLSTTGNAPHSTAGATIPTATGLPAFGYSHLPSHEAPIASHAPQNTADLKSKRKAK